jgi:hypothetical protein
LSIGVTFAIATILGSLSARVNQMLEDESWTSAPPSRAIEASVDDLSPLRAPRATRATHGSRSRS